MPDIKQALSRLETPLSMMEKLFWQKHRHLLKHSGHYFLPPIWKTISKIIDYYAKKT